MIIHKRYKAKPISYGTYRNYSDIKYIVIHYTGNKGDTAKNNAQFFATSNTRKAGAHYFIGAKGVVYESIPIELTAWSVGGGKYTESDRGASAYYRLCNNNNSISIELCDCVDTYTDKQLKACKKLIKRIKKQCPNIIDIIRHWDVNGKACPLPMIGKNNPLWVKFKGGVI